MSDEKTWAVIAGEVLESLGKVMDEAQRALFARDRRRLTRTEKAFAEYLKASLPLFEKSGAKKKKTEEDEKLMALLPVLQGIGMGARDLLGAIRAILGAHVSFTDKALAEISEIMAFVKDLARDAGDVLVTKDARFRAHALTSARAILKRADDCGKEHGKRLSKGICSARSSFLYLDVMRSLKKLASDMASLLEAA